MKNQYKTIEEWIECDEIFPDGSWLFVVGSDNIYLADGKSKFNDLVVFTNLKGVENKVKQKIKQYYEK